LKVSRKKQKEETRQKLMHAATAALASGRSFDTLSLREIAKLAGMEHAAGLLTLMHTVREQASEGRSVIRASVETLFDYIFSNQGISRMILQESMARESAFRKAAEKLFVTMSSDLADFLVWDAQQRGVPLSHPQLAANSAVAILFTTGIALLNTPAADRDRRIEAAIVQLRMIMRGAEAMGKAT